MHKKKLLLYFVIFFSLFMLTTGIKVRGNSPASINLSYNITTQTLTAQITHNVADPNTHYIETVEIRVNNTLVATETYNDQPTSSSFTYQYTISASNGDVIELLAICNISGSLTGSLTVGSSAQGIPGYSGILMILIAAFMMLGFSFKIGKEFRKK